MQDDPVSRVVPWSELRRRLLLLYDSCALVNMLEKRFLFLSHPLE